MSDPLVAGGAPALEQQVADVLAVMDAVGSERAAVSGLADGGMVAILFAAMHPDRVSALLLHHAWARATEGVGSADAEVARVRRSEQIRSQWGDLENPWGLRWLAPSRLAEPEYPRTLARVQQVNGAEPQSRRRWKHPTTTYRGPAADSGPDPGPVSGGLRRQARRTAHSRTLEVPRRAHPECTLGSTPAPTCTSVRAGDPTHVEEFVTGTAPSRDRSCAGNRLVHRHRGLDRELSALGDQAWHARLDGHDAMVRAQLDRFAAGRSTRPVTVSSPRSTDRHVR